MFQVIHMLITVILLSIAISIIYPHGRWVWLNHPKYGYGKALAMRWKIAKPPLICAVIVILIALGLELYLGRIENNASTELNNKVNQLVIESNNQTAKIDELINSINNLINKLERGVNNDPN